MKIRHTRTQMDSARSRTALMALHAFVIGAILLQWLSSEFMAKPWSDEQSAWGQLLFSLHYWTGISTSVAFAGLVTLLCLRHGNPFAHFFPWASAGGRQNLLLEMKQIAQRASRREVPPTAETQTVAATVQGLGLSIISGIVITGILIAVVGPATPLAHEIGEIHELFFVPMLTYMGVHGAAAVLHRWAGHPLFAAD